MEVQRIYKYTKNIQMQRVYRYIEYKDYTNIRTQIY